MVSRRPPDLHPFFTLFLAFPDIIRNQKMKYPNLNDIVLKQAKALSPLHNIAIFESLFRLFLF
jgi:hypothetical protein